MRTGLARWAAALAVLVAAGCVPAAAKEAGRAVPAGPSVEVGGRLFRDGDRWSVCTGIGESSPPICFREDVSLASPPAGAGEVPMTSGEVAYSEVDLVVCGVLVGDVLRDPVVVGPWDDDVHRARHLVARFRADRTGPSLAAFPGGMVDLHVALEAGGVDVVGIDYDQVAGAVQVVLRVADAPDLAAVDEAALADPRLRDIPVHVSSWAIPADCGRPR